MWTRKLSIQLNLAHMSSWNPPFCALDCNQNADQVASPKIKITHVDLQYSDPNHVIAAAERACVYVTDMFIFLSSAEVEVDISLSSIIHYHTPASSTFSCASINSPKALDVLLNGIFYIHRCWGFGDKLYIYTVSQKNAPTLKRYS